MDWDGVIEKNREALKRIVASLIAMAALCAPTSLLVGFEAGLRRRREVVVPVARQQAEKAGTLPEAAETRQEDGSARQGEAEPRAEPGEGCLSISPALPRHLHRAVLRLLRPAEAAARRLVIVAARDVVLPPPAPSRPPAPKPIAPVLRSLGLAVFLSPAEAARAAASARRARAVRKAALPLFDPIRLPGPDRPRYVPAHAAPRILSFGVATPHRLPPPPSPNDPIDATRLALRLTALARALDDLPREARRLARWKLRRDAAGAQNEKSPHRGWFRRISPLRPGRPPGLSAANRRRPAHEVHEVLGDLQYFAFKALQAPDTS